MLRFRVHFGGTDRQAASADVGNLYRQVSNDRVENAGLQHFRAIRILGMKLAYPGKAGENPGIQGSCL